MFNFIDLFAGIGATRLGWEAAGGQCVMTVEWDRFAQQTYRANHHATDAPDHVFATDVRDVDASQVPDHDVVLAGFPCQAFSISGVSKSNSMGRPHGLADSRGTLFGEVARIVDAKRPRAFMLENVVGLPRHDKGRTFDVIRGTFTGLGYSFRHRVVDARAWVPQKRQRIFMVGFRDAADDARFDFDDLVVPDLPHPVLADILEPSVDPKYTLSDKLWSWVQAHAARHASAGNGFGYGLCGPGDVARTLSARYGKDGSEILIAQSGQNPRKLTPRECARLMGFPDSFNIPVSDTQAWKQFGNSMVVPVVAAVARLTVAAMR